MSSETGKEVFLKIKQQWVKNFVSACDRRKLTTVVILQKIDETSQNFSNYMHNDRELSEKKICSWCIALGIPFHEIFNLPEGFLSEHLIKDEKQ